MSKRFSAAPPCAFLPVMTAPSRNHGRNHQPVPRSCSIFFAIVYFLMPFLSVKTSLASQAESDLAIVEKMVEHHNRDRYESRKYIKDVYDAKNLGIIALALESPVLRGDLIELIFEEHDEAYLNQLLVILLRSSADTFGDTTNNPIDIDPSPMIRIRCYDILKDHLPAAELRQYPLSNRSNRLHIAEIFVQKMGIALPSGELSDVDGLAAKRVWPPKPGTGQGVPQDGGDATKPGLPGAVAAAAKPAETASRLSGWALWAGMGGGLAAAVGWLLLRRKGRGGKG